MKIRLKNLGVGTMSQEIVYALLQDLGGKATTKQISELAKKRYPGYSLHAYVHVRLRSLQKWGYVKKDSNGSWVLTDISPPWKLRKKTCKG
jgi:hypothetical protein